RDMHLEAWYKGVRKITVAATVRAIRRGHAMSNHSWRAAIVGLSTVVFGQAHAQDILLDIKCPVPAAVGACAGQGADWDGDGVDAHAIGAPADGTAGVFAGAVRVYSAKSGSLITTIYGAAPNDEFGKNVVRVPDLDGDGVDDLAVGAQYASY